MALTTDPRTVTSGRVETSATSTAKRDALIGRLARHTVNPTGDLPVAVTVRITGIDCVWPTGVIVGGEFAGRTTRLGRVVTLVGEQ